MELLSKIDTAERWKQMDPVYFEKSVHFNSSNNEFGAITYFDNYKFVNSDFTYDRYATKKTFEVSSRPLDKSTLLPGAPRSSQRSLTALYRRPFAWS